jgi:diguanylate cyclase (GGDEF)-like protein
MIRIRSLRVRMVVFLVALLGVVQAAEFALTNDASYSAARSKIEDEFSVGERVFARVLQQNSERLSQAAAVLAADFAFRDAIATGDTRTLASALENQGARINAQAVLYVDLRGQVIADSLRPDAPPHPFELEPLIARARAQGGATTINLLHQQAYQLIAVPVKAPLTIGWIVVCFPLDRALAQDLGRLTGLDVSFAIERAGRWSIFATTLPTPVADALRSRLPGYAAALGTRALQMPDGQQQLRLVQLGGDAHIAAVLQRPIASAMASFRTLRTTLEFLGFLSLAISIAGSVMIALSITRPLELLLGAVRRIRGGDYSERVEALRDDEIGALAHGLEHMRTGIAQREQRILKLAYEDPLTQLPNRSQFSQALEQGIIEAQSRHETLAIMVMDLDRFKYVNDALGHGVGDHVLREVGTRLRLIQGTSGCVARLGGDEFALLVPASSTATVIDVAKSLIAALEVPIVYEGQPLDVGTSIGIAMFPAHGENSETLVRNADIAMYVAKRSRAGWAVYEKNYDSSQQEHLSLLGELRHAVEHNELRLHYQPKVDLRSATVSACEALLRWDHPRRGVVPPAAFIPFAEHTGYIKVLSRWVLEEAVRQIGQWRREGMELQVSVNISARDLLNRELPEMIGELLARQQVPPALLCLEITESGFMEDPANAITVLEHLSRIGLALSIDDYGTGYSSLSYLMRLPAKELKIDRSFVSHVCGNADLTTIVSSTIEMGHRLGMKVVAEGVEDSEAYALLQKLGCDTAQGYYMSPPLPPEAFQAWMEGRLPPARSSATLSIEPVLPEALSVRASSGS